LRIVVPVVKPEMRNEPVRLKRLVLAVNAVVLAFLNAWSVQRARSLKVPTYKTVDAVTKRSVVVASGLRSNEPLLLGATVARLDRRLLRVRLNAPLVVGGLVLTLVSRVLIVVKVPITCSQWK
jgi:hypothetical protein